MESGAPKRDTPDKKDFEGETRESEQLPEEAPPGVSGPGKKDDRKRGEHKEDR